MKLSKMNLKVFLIISSFFCVQSAPAKPLNERSTELTWQAWLLVDDQNQNKQTDADGLIRRRITPKSVFIAPTFSPDSLPPCADGYTSDPMGRCIKIIQLDADAQLNFILDRLKQQFGEIDEYDDYEEILPTPGPFQLNIPFGSEPDDKIQDTNIAIVVAPTNGNFDLTKNDTLVIKKNEHPPQSELDAPIIVTKINIKDDDEDIKAPSIVVHKNDAVTERIDSVTKKIDDSATEKVESITDEITEMFEISTEKLDGDDNIDLFAETTTTDGTPTESTTLLMETTTDLPETTTLPIETTRLEQALFFKLPNVTKTDETIEASEDKQIENYVRFPEEHLSQTQLLPEINIRNRFRDEPIIKQKLPAIEINNKFEPTLFENINPDDRRIFNNRDTSNHNLHHRQPEVVTHHIQESQNYHDDRLHPAHRVFNHRNRDKTWQFPPDYRETQQPQKPLVLRFTNGNHRQANDFYQHHPRQHDAVYRQVPPDDLSYIFGFKKGITHR